MKGGWVARWLVPGYELAAVIGLALFYAVVLFVVGWLGWMAWPSRGGDDAQPGA